MLLPTNNCDFVLFRGGEMVFNAFGHKLTMLSPVVLESVAINHQGHGEVVCESDGGIVSYATFNPHSIVDMRFRGSGAVTASDDDRRSMVKRICDGLSVNELLAVIQDKLMERKG